MSETAQTLTIQGKNYRVFNVSKLNIPGGLNSLPYSIRILLENVLRKSSLGQASVEDIKKVLAYAEKPGQDIAYYPSQGAYAGFYRSARGCRPCGYAGCNGCPGGRPKKD